MINKSYIKTNVPDLVVDPKSGALLNVSTRARDDYRMRKKNMRVTKDTVSRLDALERDIAEIKSLLKGILEKSCQ